MANLLDLVDSLIGDVLQGNIYSDVSSYRATLPAQPHSIPAGAFASNPNADPRRLNFPGVQHPPGTIPEIREPGPTPLAGTPVHSQIGSTTDKRPLDLTPGVGFTHPHDAISSKALPRHQNAAGIPVIPPPMHDAEGVFTDPSTGVIQGNKRQSFYASQGSRPPLDISQQTQNLAENAPPPPSEQARRLARGAIYGAGGNPSFGQPVPGGSISSAPTFQPPAVSNQRDALETNSPPPPGVYQGGENPTSADGGPLDKTVRQLTRPEIYRGADVPLRPGNVDTVPSQAASLDANTPPPPGTFHPTSGPVDQTIRQLSRPEIYGGADIPLIPGDPDISPSQAAALKGDSPPPPGTFHPTSGPVDQTVRQLTRPEIYPDRGPNSELMALADFHEAASRPFSPTQTAERRFSPENPDSQIPQTPAEAGATQQKFGSGIGPGEGHVDNEFANSPHRPLNFRGADDAPDRLDLVAKSHPQHMGWNASGLELTDQRHGTITDNLYDDTNTPFEGNFQGSFRERGVPAILNYFNILATGHWLRNIGTELGLGDVDRGFADGGPPGTDGDLSKTVEGLAKGAAFVANQFLLTAMNPANAANGIANAIWNPLSITAAIPAAGGLISDITAGAASGLGIYGDNIKGVDDAGASMLLLARRGAHSEARPLERLSKILPPLSPPGFVGETVGVGGDTLDGNQKLRLPGVASTIDAQTGGPGEELAQSLGVHTNLYHEGRQYKDKAIFPMEKLAESAAIGNDPGADKLANMFDAISRKNNSVFSSLNLSPTALEGTPGAQASTIADWRVRPRIGQNDGFSRVSLVDAPGINASIVEAALPGEEILDSTSVNFSRLPDGTVDRPIDDGNIYMPFMFQDLREIDKFLYFRAFLKGDLNETFTPEWNAERFYGRVDMVPVYKGTNRTLNFSFDVAAFRPVDLKVIWDKLHKLHSMVYPTYDQRGFMEQGPMIRLRIGDLFAGENSRGLPGYITAMDFSFPDGIWNIQKDFKVPRLITVAMSFTVVHDGNPGTYPEVTNDVDGKIVATDEKNFGAGKITSLDNGNVPAVSLAEIRRIFSTVRN